MNCTETYKFVNTPLPYAFDALEPYIDEKTMWLHHNKHLQTYIDNLNNTLEPYKEYWNWTLERLICCETYLPNCIREKVHNNAGGVFNHRLYFEGIGAPHSCDSYQMVNPQSYFAETLCKCFGSYEEFKNKMKSAALSVFGSGYAWLVINCRGKFEIMTTVNQDTVLPCGNFPILNIDVWEHAYYLKHYNKRDDYIDDWFKVIDWKVAEERFSGDVCN